LRPPFKSQFDRSHWWEDRSQIEPVAALYELARRHPLVREQWIMNFAAATRSRRGVATIREPWMEKIMQPQAGNDRVAPSLYWTCLLGLKSWAKLDYTDRRNWEFCVGYLKGLDFRDEELHCRSIKQLANWRIRCQREDALGDKVKGKKRGREIGEIISADLAAKPPTVEEWDAAIAQSAIEAHRRGYVLLAVAPHLAVNKAQSVMTRKYHEHLELYPPLHPKQRARWEDWLPIIAEFEDAEANGPKAKSQVFARYRRTLDAIRFV
jgi:hypothetical protein